MVKFKEVARKVDATNDFFIRTTDPQHEAYVQAFLRKVYERGDIYENTYSGFIARRVRLTMPRRTWWTACADHGTAPVHMEERTISFDYRPTKTASPSTTRPTRLRRPRHRYNEALSFIEQGLEDISVSRATLKWGIPVPWDESQVVYVWVDALINYPSALSYAGAEDLTERFWPPTCHLMAQDILKFHGIIWPALLMSAGYELPEHLFIHGYLKLGGEKMSKTRGNVMDPFPLIEQYGADPFRFYCLREVNFGQDGVVGEESFKNRYNAELANELGNLLSRTESMIGKYRGGNVPAPPESAAHSPLVEEAAAAVAAARDGLQDFNLSGGLEAIWGFVRFRLNRYVEERAPWKQAKAGEDTELDATLWNLAEGLRLLAVLLHAYMPATSDEILSVGNRAEWKRWRGAGRSGDSSSRR